MESNIKRKYKISIGKFCEYSLPDSEAVREFIFANPPAEGKGDRIFYEAYKQFYF